MIITIVNYSPPTAILRLSRRVEGDKNHGVDSDMRVVGVRIPRLYDHSYVSTVDMAIPLFSQFPHDGSLSISDTIVRNCASMGRAIVAVRERAESPGWRGPVRQVAG
jgi:hypothetical protein